MVTRIIMVYRIIIMEECIIMGGITEMDTIITVEEDWVTDTITIEAIATTMDVLTVL